MQNKKVTINKFIFLAVFILSLLFSFNSSALAVSNCTKDDDCKYAGQKCVEQSIGVEGKTEWRCARALEIVYPNIPGQLIPETVATGIPEYFKYIFQLSVVLIGFVIFGALVYSGFNFWLFSAGNPSKFADARTGILSAFLGAIVLFSSWLIFNTINPQLTILTLPNPSILEQIVTPGVYICNYNYEAERTIGDYQGRHIGDILSEYVSKEGEEQIEAAKELQRIIVNPDNRKETCQKANYSGNFQNFVVEENDTMFVVPSIRFSAEIKPGTTNEYEYIKKPMFEYGFILHEKDDFAGKCVIYPTDSWIIYTQTKIDDEGRFTIEDTPYNTDGAHLTNPVKDFKAGNNINDFRKGKARSITIFKKAAVQPNPDAQGLRLYMCIDYDRAGVCPTEHFPDLFHADTGKPRYKESGGDPPNIAPSGLLSDRIDRVFGAPIPDGMVDLSDVAPVGGGGVRSVKIDPKDLVFAVLRGYNLNCTIIKQNNPDISNIRLTKCDAGVGWENGLCNTVHGFIGIFHWGGFTEKCVPCISQIILIDGQVL